MNLDIEISKLAPFIEEMEQAFLEVQQPRPDYMLEHFVIGQHDTEPQQYAQCVVEMQIKWDAIRRAQLHRRKLEIEIEQLTCEAEAEEEITTDYTEKSEKSVVEEDHQAELKRLQIGLRQIDIEEQDRAMLGAIREFKALYGLWRGFPKRYTREELNAAQEEYWIKRLTRQAHQDLLASGRVSVGSQEALKQIGRAPLPELDHVRDVERRYLEVGDRKILVAVPTVEKAVEGLPCLEGLIIPSGVQAKYYNVWGRETAEAYNDAAMTCLRDGADFLLTVEDDTFPPADALVRLLRYFDGNEDKVIVGAWYPKRNEAREGAPIVLRGRTGDGPKKRQALQADGEVHEVYTLPMGCTLFPAQVFLATDFPYFVWTEHLTQDSFFSQKAREAGYRLLCDTSIRCRHVDRETGEVFQLENRARLTSAKSGQGLRVVLHVGCGPKNDASLHPEFRGEDWQEIWVDIDPRTKPDIVASITDMGVIEPDIADAVWSSHNLEHLYTHEVPRALQEVLRVLMPGGYLLVTVPDLQAVCQHVADGNLEGILYQSPAGPISAIDVLFGHRASIAAGNTFMSHRTGFTAESLYEKLVSAGFVDVQVERSDLTLWARAYKGKGAEECQ